ncbi:MAG: 2-oxoacid:acceptor oxidoreductase family protein [Nitrospiraceae bacterium]|nr:2-oxoacid:acceptor oxidoreductase family protein [Nitrospiraceae bacterium]
MRFHGRGGQGAKTASRILGTAAFLSGFQAQDAPIYGAERRGAPVAAFTRIARRPIRERGVIAHPDLVVVADASLISDPTAHVMDGIRSDTAVFVNSPLSKSQVWEGGSFPGPIMMLDLTGVALERLGKREAISALLGAVAARVVGVDEASLRGAIGRELTDLGVSAEAIERNQAAADFCYRSLTPAPLPAGSAGQGAKTRLQTPVYESPTLGTAHIGASANSVLRETGGWRTFRPVLIPNKCNGCWLCFAFCPDGVIAMTAEDKPVIDYDHCKGCQICVQECPTHALVAEREQEGAAAWRAK